MRSKTLRLPLALRSKRGAALRRLSWGREGPRMIISADLRASVNAYVLAEFPKEACGFVVDGAFVPAKNIAREPEQDFLIAPLEYLAAERTGKLEAILHSHPNGPLHPSKADMQSQVNTALPWIIVMTDGKTVHYDW